MNSFEDMWGEEEIDLSKMKQKKETEDEEIVDTLPFFEEDIEDDFYEYESDEENLYEDNNYEDEEDGYFDELGFEDFSYDYQQGEDNLTENEILEDLRKDFEEQPNIEDMVSSSSSYIETGWIYDLNLDLILSLAIEEDASDIHLTEGEPVCFTKYKKIIKKYEFPIPDETTMNDMSASIMTSVQHQSFVSRYELDFPYTIKHGRYAGRRFRGNAGRSNGADFFVFRTINDKIPSLEDLSIEQELVDWVNLPNGVWIVGGATGSGKSTTLASLLHHIQMTQPKKIITIEKPIEYTYPKDSGLSLVVQREVGEGQDTLSFDNGLTAAMRENPDIILIGEVRNTEEVSELIRAAETGHLAISTIHTNSVPTTINRIFSLFPTEEQGRIRSTLSDTLKGLVNQNLVPKKDEDGVFVVREILTITDEIRKMILKGDVLAIKEYMINNELTMEQQLYKAYKEDKCTYEEARKLAPDVLLFDRLNKET